MTITTITDNDNLLPCPCCESQAKIVTDYFMKVMCINCGLSTITHSEEHRQLMIDSWNTRNGKLEVKE